MNTVIAFSGGCYSGKTSFIDFMEKIFGDDCVVLREVVRDKQIGSIDELRKDGSKYFEFQKEVITEKIEQEKQTKYFQNKIVLIDRSLVDSMFYFLFYTNKSDLSLSELKSYNQFFTLLKFTIKEHFENIYDFVWMLKPIKEMFKLQDNYRPKAIDHLKNIESFNISVLNNYFDSYKIKIVNFDKNIDVQENFYLNFVLRRKRSNFSIYETYNALLKSYYTIDNLYMNRIGSVSIENDDFGNINSVQKLESMLSSALLFSDDLNKSEKILGLINKLDLDNPVINETRCYPTGLFTKNNVMIVGEAPGFKGKASKEDYLKPSFVFERTSFLLRRSIMMCEFNRDAVCPYITNLCKYADENNQVTDEDFIKCWDIFLYELEVLKPSKIIVLGNKAFSFLSTHLSEENKVKSFLTYHPSYCIRGGITEENYINGFKKVIKI